LDSKMVKILLVMIVKNESKIIQRCLTEAKPVIDNFSIVDTGSTDNTVELIQEWAKLNQVVGQVVFHPWKNFGYNRSHSFVVGKEYAIQLKYDLKNSYTIFIDADMMLETTPKFNKHILTKESYHLEQRTGEFFYHNLRLARLDIDWKCVGVTHEFWSGGAGERNVYDLLKINDIGDGGAKADKYERDKKYLLDGLVEEPNNSRYFFYLAQTLYHLKEHDKSIEYYKKRIDAGGWHEEVWYSYYRVAENYVLKGDIFSATDWCMRGYDFYQGRSECLAMVGSFLRRMGNHGLSYHFLKLALAIPVPRDDVLFIDGSIYKFAAMFEQMLNCEKLDNKQREGLGYCHKLLKLRDLPQHLRPVVLKCIGQFIQPLGIGDNKELDITEPLQSAWRNGQGYIGLNLSQQCMLISQESQISSKKQLTVNQIIQEHDYEKEKICTIQFGNHISLYRNYDFSVQKLQSIQKPIVPLSNDLFIDQLDCLRIFKIGQNQPMYMTSDWIYNVEKCSNFVSFANGFLSFVDVVIEGKRYHQMIHISDNFKEHIYTIPFYFLSSNEKLLHCYVNTVHMKEGKKSVVKNNVCLLYQDENGRLREWSTTPENMRALLGKK